jgi:hypothetical protein
MHTNTEKQTIHSDSRNIIVDKSVLFNNPSNVIEEHDKIMKLLETNPEQAATHLESLYKKHSDEPIIASHLVDAYQRIKKEDAAHQLIKDNYRLFPLSIFARCDYAHLCLQEGHPMAAATAIEYTFDLAKLYPKRSEFHLLEVLEFQSLLVHYFCAIKDFNRAIASVASLKKIHKSLPGIDRLRTTIIVAALQETLSAQNIEELFGSEEDYKNNEIKHQE